MVDHCSYALNLSSCEIKALHRYRRGHGFESRSGLNFFQALISQLLFFSDFVELSFFRPTRSSPEVWCRPLYDGSVAVVLFSRRGDQPYPKVASFNEVLLLKKENKLLNFISVIALTVNTVGAVVRALVSDQCALVWIPAQCNMLVGGVALLR